MRFSSPLPLLGAALIVLAIPTLASAADGEPVEATVPAPAAVRHKPGMDISVYQGDIDWAQVGNGQITFAITRASHGEQADANYEANRAGAAAEGIAFGAYHYAEPHGTTQRAVEQADFFLDAATPQAGDLLPVLDLEATGGKSPGLLIKWVAAFLNRVEHQTSVKPMIYTSPSFWQTAMADTERFARHGNPLWIAHWETSSPTVPARNWGGDGWTFWQWTDCRSVNGIDGCVDGDRYRGKNLHRAQIPA